MYNKSFHCRCSYCQVRPPILSLKEKKDGLYASVYGSQWWRFGSAYAATTEDISGLADSYYTANTTCQGEGYLDALCGSHGQAAKIASDNSFPFLMLHFFLFSLVHVLPSILIYRHQDWKDEIALHQNLKYTMFCCIIIVHPMLLFPCQYHLYLSITKKN